MRGAFSRLIFLTLAFAVLLLPASCPNGKKGPNARKTEAKDGGRDTFVIALLPRENIFHQKRRYQPLAEYLSKALGMNVKTKLLDSYEAVYDEMATGQVDAAFFGGLSYVVMDSRVDIEPVARPVHEDGRSTYRGVIFARRDGGITPDVSTWKGKRMALVSRSTTTGYLFPRWYLHKNGVKKLRAYFGRIFYVGSHDATIRAVLDDKADIGCSTDRIFDRFLTQNPTVGKDLIILASSGAFPTDTLGIKKGDLDSRRRKLLKETLLRMDETEKGRAVLSVMGASRFVGTPESDYDGIRAMMKELSLGPGFFSLDGVGRSRGGERSHGGR